MTKELVLDRDNLQEEFDMDPLEQEMVSLTKSLSDDPIDSLKDNVDRANDILDMVESELESGNFSARLAEVAGQLINSVTNASKEIISSINYQKYLQIRESLVELKRIEIENKNKQSKIPSSQNIIITDRESVLRFLEENKEPKKVEGTVETTEPVYNNDEM